LNSAVHLNTVIEVLQIKSRKLINLRTLYRPTQPTIKAENRDISYLEIQPDPYIEKFIYCFWQLKTKLPLGVPYTYRVVSDGCIDIFFSAKKSAENFVMGFCRKYTEFSIGKEFNYIGIRFLPSAFPILFGIDARSLSNQSQELIKILPELSQWISTAFNPSCSFENVTNRLNERFKQIIQQKPVNPDQRFLKALSLIFDKKGFLDLENDIDTGLSPRQLRRVFNHFIGTSPKAFCNVVRFQHILNAKPSKESLKENRFYLDVGFFDQAHFIKDFKNFYGVTPSQAFS
jgi:AraC-like DNA-binding protein